jgi:uncharacterized repeat protein (TIGR01451 family)
VQFTATPSDGGTFANPRAAGICQVDPDALVAEGNETNNDCSDTVRILSDLTVSKAHSGGSIATAGTPFTWTVNLTNNGHHGATFGDREIVFTDNLPDSDMDYGAVMIANVSGVSSTGDGIIDCAIDGSANLRCEVSVSGTSGGSVTIEPGGGFDVVFTATPRGGGTFTNPRASGMCRVDPDSLVEELDEGNNDCSDSLEVFHLGISRVEDDLQLEWTDVGAVRYSLWHSMEAPYFVPGADCSMALNCKTIGGTSFYHSGGAGDGNRYFYLVEAIDGSDHVFTTSNRVGKLMVDILPGLVNGF